MPGASTVWSGNRGICMGVRPAYADPGIEEPPGIPAASSGGSWRARVARRAGQWEQERAVPASSAVRKLEPQPQPETAFGLLTVKPAPMRVST